ncbi:hypothetical protein [Dyella silvae]|uniref:hypothetical protein n=1 Tax=Dyella silvae TaxID=2994424 RepID=UPI002263C87B|nr:hypothetical protein [Dyella silvae]
MIVVIALSLIFTGALLVYLASEQQRLRKRSLSTTGRRLGGLLLVAGIACWMQEAGTGAGIAAALTTLMLVWVTLPYLAWWRGPGAENTQS